MWAVCIERCTFSLVGGRWNRAVNVPRQLPTQHHTWKGPKGETLDGTNNACERAIGWWIKERYRTMRGYYVRENVCVSVACSPGVGTSSRQRTELTCQRSCSKENRPGILTARSCLTSGYQLSNAHTKEYSALTCMLFGLDQQRFISNHLVKVVLMLGSISLIRRLPINAFLVAP